MTTREVVVAVGSAALAGTDLVLELGPHHPSSHGLLRLALQLEDDVVVAADPLVGHLHRGAEKLFEVRDYRQALTLANRHDWTSAFGSEVGLALAVERMLGMEVPARAVWLRTLLCELERALNHLAFLPGADRLHPEREALRGVFEEVSGGRVHHVLNQVGGLKADVPAGWASRCGAAVAQVRGVLGVLDPSLRSAIAATTGLGVLSAADVLSHGASGPVARASGVDLDLRRDEPYLAYAALAVSVVLGSAGDCAARWTCLLEQVLVSLDLVAACLDRLPAGDVSVRLPKTVRAPEGSTYAWTENPLGLMGWYLVSRGEKTPWRLAMRTASFGNVSVLPALLPGTHLSDVATVLASLFFVVGDLDK